MNLQGIAVVITRNRAQNATLRELLESRGAEVVSVPTLRFVATTPAEAVREALLAHADYTHLAFSSQTAVDFFARACGEIGIAANAWDHVDMSAVGPATSSALEEHGWTASVVTGGGGESLARELIDSGRVDSKSRVLIPRSSIARPELERLLAETGARVTAVAIYDTAVETPECAEAFLTRMRKGGPPDAILFASPSAVGAFLELTGDVGETFLARAATRVISIGGTTSAAVRERGFEVSAEADPPGLDGLVAALEAAVG